MKKIFLLMVMFAFMFTASLKVTAQIKEMEVGNVLLTQDKGLAIKFTASEDLLHGELVQADTGTGYVKKNADTGSTKTVGIVYVRGTKTDTILEGSSVWVVISGICEVRIDAPDSASTDQWMKASETTAGITHLTTYSLTNNKNSQIGWAVTQTPFKRNGLWFTKAILKFP